MVKKIKNNFELLFAIGMVLIYHIRFLSIRTIINVDEFSSLAVPAFFAGYEWNINANWHGYGFTIFMAPFFALFHDFYSIYNVIQIGSLLLNVGCVILVYYTLWNMLHLPKNVSAIAAAVYSIGTLSPYDEVPLSALSEVPFAFLFLFLIYLIMRTYQMNGKKRIVLSILAGAIMAYGSLIHSRSIVMYISVIMALIITKLVTKKNLVIFPIFISSFLCSLFVMYLLDHSIIEMVYMNSEIKNNVTEISGKMSHNLFKLLSKEKLMQCFITFFSLISTLVLWSCGMFSYLVVGCIYTFFVTKKKPSISELNIFLATIGFLAVIGMNFALGLNSTGDVGKGNYRWFSYIRYSLPFMGPLFMQGVWMLYHNYFSKKLVFCTGMVSVFAVKYLLSFIVPILNDSGYGLKYNIIGHIGFSEINGTTSQIYGFLGVVTLLVTIAVSFSLLRTPRFIGVPYIVFSIIISMNTYQYYSNRDNANIERISESSKVIEKIEELAEVNKVSLFYGGSTKYVYYLRLNNLKVPMLNVDSVHDINWEDSVYVTDILYLETENRPLYSFHLNKDQFLLTSNDTVGEELSDEYEYEYFR